MRFRLLGPLEVWTGQHWQGVGAERYGPVLAALLINAGQIVPMDVLVSEVWGDQPPAGLAARAISAYVLRLRRLLGDPDGSFLVTCPSGYELRLGAADSFVVEPRQAGDLAEEVAANGEAIAVVEDWQITSQ